MLRLLSVLLCIFWIASGCSSTPRAISDAEVQPVTVEQARHAPDAHRGKRVRWGGSIVAVENRRDASWVEVLSRPLDGNQEPDAQGPAGGRFLARLQGFVDPAVYAPDRLVTVVGRLAGNRQQLIGEYPYSYAVLEADIHHLWPVEQQPYYRAYPPYDPWFNPWFDPWYRPWPYHWHR